MKLIYYILIWSSVQRSGTVEQDHCPASQNTKSQIRISWPAMKINEKSISSPICLNREKVVEQKKCCVTNCKSDKEPTCSYLVHSPNKCPLNYEENGGACFKISENVHPFNNTCFNSDYGAGIKLKSLLNSLKSITHPSSEYWIYHRLFDTKFTEALQTQIKDHGVANFEYIRNCYKYTNGEIVLDDCERKLPSICLTSPPKFMLMQLACPANEYAGRNFEYQDRCFSIVPNDGSVAYTNEDLFEPSTSYDWILYEKLLAKYNQKYCMVKFGNINYTLRNYSSMSFTFERNKTANCVVLNKTLTIDKDYQQPELHLQFDEKNYRISLTVYAENFIFRESEEVSGIACYAKHNRKMLKLKRLDSVQIRIRAFQQNITQTRTTYDVEFKSEYPNIYQCSCHRIKKEELIESAEVLAYKQIDNFLFAVKMNLSIDKEFLYDIVDAELDSNWSILGSTKYNILTQYKIIEDINIHQIESYDPATTQATLIFHIQVKCTKSPKDVANTLRLRNQLQSDMKLRLISVNSTQFCFAEDLAPDEEKFKWNSTAIGETALSDPSCFDAANNPYVRRCVGNRVLGGMWEEFDAHQKECHPMVISKATQDIIQLRNAVFNNDTLLDTTTVFERIEEITERADDIIPFGIAEIASTLREQTNRAMNDSNIRNDSETVSNIVSNLLNVETQVIQNATHLQPSAADNILTSHRDWRRGLLNNIATDDKGVYEKYEENLMEFVITPEKQGITGILLFEKLSGNTLSTNMSQRFHVEYLNYNHTDKDILEMRRDNQLLEIGAYFPSKLYESLKSEKRQMNISISVFLKNNLHNVAPGNVVKIITITIPGFPTKLKHLLPTYYGRTNNSTLECQFYSDGEWDKTGCKLRSSTQTDASIIMCGCSHLTHFSALLTGESMLSPTSEAIKVHNKILDLISQIGCSLSVVGSLGMIITVIKFHKKSKAITLQYFFMAQLSFALMLEALWLLFAEMIPREVIPCLYSGSFIQYIVLVTFVWMTCLNVLAFLQLTTLKLLHFDTSKVLKIAMSCSWGIPLIPTIISAYIAPSLYESPLGFCYPKSYALYVFVVMPIGILLLANLAIYIRTVLITKKQLKPQDNYQKNTTNDSKDDKLFLYIAISMSLQIGLTWISGLISIIPRNPLAIIFNYIFCVTSSLQGFFLCLWFVVFNKNVSELWIARFKYPPKDTHTTQETSLSYSRINSNRIAK